MKRMYVTLFIICAALLWALTAIGQKVVVQDPPPEREKFDRQKRRQELRQQMHRRMMERLMNGNAADPNMFQDMEKMFEDALQESFADMNALGFGAVEQNFKSEWLETKTGKTLVITPNKDQKLDIDVNETMVTIKGIAEKKTPNGSYVSNFSNSFSVPADCDGSKVKMNQKDGNILIEFPFKTGKAVTIHKTPTPPPALTPQAPTPPDRQPIRPSEGDVEI